MKQYTESTDGSSIEIKESALVWQYRDADPGFGSLQAKEMLEHLESVQKRSLHSRSQASGKLPLFCSI